MAEKYKITDPLNLNLVSTSVGKRSFFINLIVNYIFFRKHLQPYTCGYAVFLLYKNYRRIDGDNFKW
jgi:hypothetical protein